MTHTQKLFALSAALALAGCATSQTQTAQDAAKVGPRVSAGDPMNVQPDGQPPKFAPDIDPQMAAVIEEFGASEPPMPITRLTPFQFRNATLPAEAVMSLLKKTGIKAAQPKVDVAHKLLPVGPDEGILVRTYTPLTGSGPFPVIVYYHGGGWVIADLDTYEAGAMALAEKAGAVVVSVAYRQAPEHTFPAFHEDAYAAYEYVTQNAATMNGDPSKVATAGESAGGNLAVAVALMAKQRGGQMPVHIVSVYPIADGDTESASYTEYAEAKPLSKPLMDWFFKYAVPDESDRDNPLISLTSADVTGLPPTTIINAQIDPLEAEGGELADRMKSAGIDVERKVYSGVTHEFFGMSAVLEQAQQAQQFAADRLKASFGM